MINVGKRQVVVVDRYLSALVYSISILSYFQVEEGYGDYLWHQFLMFSVELILKIIYSTAENEQVNRN